MLPNLETPRLALRPRSLADLDDFLAMDSDPAVARYIWGIPPNPEERRAVLEKTLRCEKERPGGSWTVVDKATTGFFGWCGLIPLEETGLIEIGYRYLPKAWGRGIATEAAECVLDYGFRTFEFDPILAVIHPDNRASQRVSEKIGLVRQADGFHYGQTAAVFSLSRADYLASRIGRGDGPAQAVNPSDLPRIP